MRLAKKQQTIEKKSHISIVIRLPYSKNLRARIFRARKRNTSPYEWGGKTETLKTVSTNVCRAETDAMLSDFRFLVVYTSHTFA